MAGAILVDKPVGPTSHDVVAQVRRALKIRAVGHTGTLDPFASGLLVVMVGRATRLARFVEDRPKTYLGTARLGVCTATDDSTGAVIAEADPAGITEAAVREALEAFRGTTTQRPPSFSAKRVAGERSYRRARRGEAVSLPEVPVTVHAISLVAYTSPHITFRATVSAGTYIRALARDLGERLGVGAHLHTLRREAIGTLQVEEAVALDELAPEAMIPAREVLRHLPAVTLTDAERRAVVYGQRIRQPGWSSPALDDRPHPGARELAWDAPASGGPMVDDPDAPVALISGDELVAIAVARTGTLQPVVVLEAP